MSQSFWYSFIIKVVKSTADMALKRREAGDQCFMRSSYILYGNKEQLEIFSFEI